MRLNHYSYFKLFIVLVSVFLMYVSNISATTSQIRPSVYIQAIKHASLKTGVPEPLLLCIARVESGRSTVQGLQPHPWAVNVEGKSKFFINSQEALAYIKKCLAQGVTNIDIGLMQLNWKYHNQEFPQIEAMLDPAINVLYAAKFLKRLRIKQGSWSRAVAAYHSSQPRRGQAYIIKIASHLTFKRNRL